MVDSATRSSERLKEKAKKEKEQDEEEKKLAKEAELKAQGLPTDGFLEFRVVTKPSNSKAFQIKYKDVYRTTDNARICAWAIEAYWDVNKFYPGQILKFTHAFPQCDPTAKFHEGIATYATTSAGPVGAKYRYAVVLWTTTVGLFILPLYTMNDGYNFKSIGKERTKDFVTLTLDTVKDPHHTAWAGHSILMNYNPAFKLAPCCYADLSMARSIHRLEYLQEDIGSIDGDEYLRLLSLYKIRSNEWLKRSFDQFECGVTFDDSMIVQPSSVFEKRKEYDDLEVWQKIMADKKFKGSFLSLKARQRYTEKMKKPKKKKST